MSKANILQKGFSNLIKATEIKPENNSVQASPKPKTIEANPKTKLKEKTTAKIKQYSDIDVNINENKLVNKVENNEREIHSLTIAKYKSFKKCTLYLPQEIIEALAIEKIKTKKDLSVLTAEALVMYLKK